MSTLHPFRCVKAQPISDTHLVAQVQSRWICLVPACDKHSTSRKMLEDMSLIAGDAALLLPGRAVSPNQFTFWRWHPLTGCGSSWLSKCRRQARALSVSQERWSSVSAALPS